MEEGRERGDDAHLLDGVELHLEDDADVSVGQAALLVLHGPHVPHDVAEEFARAEVVEEALELQVEDTCDDVGTVSSRLPRE